MTDTPRDAEQGPQERAYAVICLMALLLVVVLLMFEGLGVWSVLPMLIGGVAFLMRWRSGPPLVLFTFLWMAPTQLSDGFEPDTFLSAMAGFSSMGAYGTRRWQGQPVSFEDVLLCAALLTYTAACYRSLALAHSAFPPDVRRFRALRKGVSAQSVSQLVPRPAEPVSQLELPVLFGTLAATVLIGFLLWLAASNLPAWLELSETVWRNAVLFWVFVLVVALGLAFFRYQARRRAPPQENLLYLQDQLWRQTRREQSVLNRWLVWARLRWQRRKEQ